MMRAHVSMHARTQARNSYVQIFYIDINSKWYPNVLDNMIQYGDGCLQENLVYNTKADDAFHYHHHHIAAFIYVCACSLDCCGNSLSSYTKIDKWFHFCGGISQNTTIRCVVHKRHNTQYSFMCGSFSLYREFPVFFSQKLNFPMYTIRISNRERLCAMDAKVIHTKAKNSRISLEHGEERKKISADFSI